MFASRGFPFSLLRVFKMAYHDFNDTQFDYSLSSTSGGLYEYPFPYQALAVEEIVDRRSETIPQPGPDVGHFNSAGFYGYPLTDQGFAVEETVDQFSETFAQHGPTVDHLDNVDSGHRFYGYPFSGQTLAVAETDDQVFNTSANYWGPVPLGPIAGPSTNHFEAAGDGKHHFNLFVDWRLTHASSEPVVEGTSFEGVFDDYQPSYMDPCWHTTDQQPEPDHTGSLIQGDFSPYGMIAPGVSTAIQAPSSGTNWFLFATLKDKTLTYRG